MTVSTSFLPADAPFADEINAYQEADKQQMPPIGAVLFLGSSSIRLWETLGQDFPELPVINRGFGGSQIADSARYADRIAIPYVPKLIVFYAGVNDIGEGRTPEQILADFQTFVAKVHAALPATRIAYVSINPSLMHWDKEAGVLEANRLIESFVHETTANGTKLSFLDSHARMLGADGQPQAMLLQDDGLHLNDAGYRAWKVILKPEVLALAEAEGVS